MKPLWLANCTLTESMAAGLASTMLLAPRGSRMS